MIKNPYSFVKDRIPLVDVAIDFSHASRTCICTNYDSDEYYKMACIFCDDKGHNFVINKEKNIFYCHLCNTTGDIFYVVERMKNINAQKALLYLIDKYSCKFTDEELSLLGDAFSEKVIIIERFPEVK
jgi:DNA primase